ncbi:MAG: YczE/YyaS/YitT family protein [Methylococcales bacterium]
MLKPVLWKTFPRDFLMTQIGFVLFGIAIALMIRSNLGTTPWAVLELALSQYTNIRPGRMSILVGFVVLLGALALREKIGWGTLTNILFIGLWEDMFLAYIPPVNDQPIIQSAMLFATILIMGFASAIYIGVDAGAGPRDSLMLAVHRTTKLSIRHGRAIIETIVVAVGWLLGGPLGVGTVIFAVLIGPAVQWAFELLKVQPHKPEAEIAQAAMD